MSDRYARQTLLAGIGRAGQARLAAACVVVVGVGATGGVVAGLLARAGVGRLRLIDRDYVEMHNLQRQPLFSEADVAASQPKAIAAASALRAANSTITIEPLVADLNADTAADLLGPADLILDGSDNFEARYLINDWSVAQARPWVYAGVVAAHGMTMTIVPGGPCFRCIFATPPPPGSGPTCDTVGVLGPAVGVVGALAAGEALKLLSGSGRRNPGLLTVDLWQATFETIELPARRPDCPTCARGQFDFLAGGAGTRTATLCGRDAVHVRPGRGAALDLSALASRLAAAGVADLRVSLHLARFVADNHELTVFADGRAIIKGTEDEAQARSLYARWVGI